MKKSNFDKFQGWIKNLNDGGSVYAKTMYYVTWQEAYDAVSKLAKRKGVYKYDWTSLEVAQVVR